MNGTGRSTTIATGICTPAELPKVISLFSGAGGLDWGFKKEGFEIPIAFDISETAIRTHTKNFVNTKGIAADLIGLGPSGVVEKIKSVVAITQRIGVIGGPPCQGFSRANTASRADDPRNKLPALYLDIVRELQKHFIVEFVVFENVLGMRDKKHETTYNSLISGLKCLGLDVSEKELCALDYGAPQNRKRIVVSALRSGQNYNAFKPKKRKGLKTVRAAIGALDEPVYFSSGLTPSDIPSHPNHWTMRPKSKRFKSNANKKSGRSFRRLDWEAPSPTIAFGHREIHVHPNGNRRLSIYEAMLLQGFPKSFILEGNLSQQVEQVSNAVPPPLARSIASAVKKSLLKE
jgi:DNA (cytosine-5)-methyltransferase 1